MSEYKPEQFANTRKLRLCGTEPESIVDGPGFRYVIFVQGCPHHCPGCHNPQSHDFNGGYEVTEEEVVKDVLSGSYLAGVTFSGGEPFCQAESLYRIGCRVKERGLSVMSYSGFTYEQLLESKLPGVKELLSITDILVDGPYVEAKRDLTLLFRGSENQRLIDMNRTRAAGHVVLYEEEY